MKVFVKTLKGKHFEIEANLQDTVADVKKKIEDSQGGDVYPAVLQMLIHQGKVLKDDMTLAENKVAENSFLVVMLTKNADGASATAAAPTSQNKVTSSGASTAAAAPTTPAQPASSSPPTLAQPPAASEPPASTMASSESDVYGQAASNLIARNNLDATVQQLLEMGGGSWDRDTVIQALRAAYNNPERAVDYLYYGIPEQAEIASVAHIQAANPPARAPQPAVPSSGPNSDPLDLFPQGLPNIGANTSAGTLDFLRHSQQFQAFRAMVQANPQILQPMLQELGKQNPHLMRLIQEHQADFVRMINEPGEREQDVLGDLASATPQSVNVTPEERDAIERLEAMGFDRALVLEVFFACNKNEELAANYLLDHVHEFEE